MRNLRSLGLAFGVVIAGIALGSLLGAAANPKMKDLPQAAWPAEAAPSGALYAPEGASVDEPSPYADGYAPPLPDEAITDWAPDYPDWTYSDFGSDFGVDFGDGPDEPLSDGAAPEPEPRAESVVLPPEPRIAGGLEALY